MPFLFGKKKTAEEIGTKAATVVQQVRRGTISREEYIKRMSQLIAEFSAAAKVMRFTFEDVNTLIACGEKLDGDDKLAFFDEFRNAIVSIREESAVLTYALSLMAYQVYILAAMQAERLNSEQRWEESLRYCQLAERTLPQIEAVSTIEAPQLHVVFGNALSGLKRYTEAYKTFMRGDSMAQNLLSKPDADLKNTERDRLQLIATLCQQEVKKLESYMKEM